MCPSVASATKAISNRTGSSVAENSDANQDHSASIINWKQALCLAVTYTCINLCETPCETAGILSVAMSLVHIVLSYLLDTWFASPPKDSKASSSGALPLLACHLPEPLQAHVVGFSGVKDCLSLSLANRRTHSELWENAGLWKALCIDAQPTATLAFQLRDVFRWNHFGINQLVAGEWLRLAVDIGRAERAVRALLWRDARHAGRLAEALGDLVRESSNTDCIQEVIAAVTAQSEVFSMEQTLELINTHHQAQCDQRTEEQVLPPQQSPALRKPQTKRHAPCDNFPAAWPDQEKMMDRLSQMLFVISAEAAATAA